MQQCESYKMAGRPYPSKSSLVINAYFKTYRNPEVYFKLEGGISSFGVSRVVTILAARRYQLLLHISVVVWWLAGRLQINRSC